MTPNAAGIDYFTNVNIFLTSNTLFIQIYYIKNFLSFKLSLPLHNYLFGISLLNPFYNQNFSTPFMKLDILAIAVHPDDVELSCSGTLIKHIREYNHKVGIVDLTHGELGTRGTPNLRKQEATNAAAIMGIHYRKILELQDGFFENNEASLRPVIEQIRLTQPQIVITNALQDRHPDHPRACKLVADACFLSGLRRIETTYNGQTQTPWRPNQIFHSIQFYYQKPDFVVDITPYMNTKREAILAYKSQFYDQSSTEPETLITSKSFLNYIEARAAEMGSIIETEFAEGFNVSKPIEIKNLMDLVQKLSQ